MNINSKATPLTRRFIYFAMAPLAALTLSCGPQRSSSPETDGENTEVNFGVPSDSTSNPDLSLYPNTESDLTIPQTLPLEEITLSQAKQDYQLRQKYINQRMATLDQRCSNVLEAIYIHTDEDLESFVQQRFTPELFTSLLIDRLKENRQKAAAVTVAVETSETGKYSWIQDSFLSGACSFVIFYPGAFDSTYSRTDEDFDADILHECLHADQNASEYLEIFGIKFTREELSPETFQAANKEFYGKRSSVIDVPRVFASRVQLHLSEISGYNIQATEGITPSFVENDGHIQLLLHVEYIRELRNDYLNRVTSTPNDPGVKLFDKIRRIEEIAIANAVEFLTYHNLK